MNPLDPETVKRMPVNEFRDDGYLQEVNRRFLHPLGLALEVTVVDAPGYVFTVAEEGLETLRRLAVAARDAELLDVEDLDALDALLAGAEHHDAGVGWLSGIWDCRDDPEGIAFAGEYLDHAKEKASEISRRWHLREPARHALLGYMVQPLRR